MRHELVAGALLSLCLALPSLARAQSSSRRAPLDPVAAEALFEEGRRALEKNDLEAACAKFEESQKLDPSVGTLMNWATCEERRGHVATAWQRWRQAIDQLPDSDDRVPFAKKHAAALEPRLPRLSITLRQGAPSDSRVLRDGIALGQASLGTPIPVDPGERTIIVQAPGFEPRTFTIALAEAERKSIEVEPGKALPPEQKIGGEAKPSSRRGLGWALIGVGGAGVATGIVTGLMLNARRDEVDANCTAAGCNETGLQAASEGKTLLVVNTVGWGAGIAGLAAGAIFVLTSGGDSDSIKDASKARSWPSVAALPLASGLGFVYRSGF